MKDFYERLKQYYEETASALKAQAKTSSIFPNCGDIGTSREDIYAKFLTDHLPRKCNTLLGGFLFGKEGEESKQIDIIVTTDTTPQYGLGGKSFAPVDGCIGVVSVKSTLDKKELFDSIENIISIPEKSILDDKINPQLKINSLDEWPYKIIYASNGISGEKILDHLNTYSKTKGIPTNKLPNIIHVLGKYIIIRSLQGAKIYNIFTGTERVSQVGGYELFNTNSDVQGMSWITKELQERVLISNHILFTYEYIVDRVCRIK